MRGMSYRLLVTLGLVILLSAVFSPPTALDAEVQDPTLRETVAELQRLYSSDIVLGKPVEIDGRQIIPLVTFGLGYGQRQGTAEQGAFQGAGGMVNPVGVLVVSKQGVQFLPVPKGVIEQVLGAVTPVLVQVLRRSGEPGAAGGSERPRITVPEVLAGLFALLPAHGWRFGLFPWPLSLVLIFVLTWLVVALLSGIFLPRQVQAIAAVLQARPLRSALVGVLSYIAALLLAALFTVSLIGIPLAVVVGVLAWVLQLLGIISIAWLLGQRLAAARNRPQPSTVVHILLGGVMLSIVRLIPILGWIVWFLLGILGLGAVLLRQSRQEQPVAPGATGA